MAAFSRTGDHRVSSASSEYSLHQLLRDAQTRWLKPAEICEILNNHHQLALSEAAPIKPTSGSLFLFDRNKIRYFRKDGHNWRKKKDGKTVREAHEKLKVGNKDAIHCYYAHGEDNPNFQRRSYWLLEGGLDNIVLVHYREVSEVVSSSSSGNRSESVDQTIQRNPEHIHMQMPSTNMEYDTSEYYTPTMVSSPSEVVSTSYNSVEGIIEVDSGDEIVDKQGLVGRIPQSYQHALTIPDLEINGVSEAQHRSQFVELGNQTPNSSCADFEDSYNKDMSTRTHFGESVSSNGTQSFKFENESQVQHYADPNVLLMNSKEKLQVTSSKQEAEQLEPYHGLLSPTVSFFMQAIRSDMEDQRPENCWENIPRSQSTMAKTLWQSHLSSAPDCLFNILDFSPERSDASGGTKVLVAGIFSESTGNTSSSRWSCRFGDIEVPAYILQSGTLRCVAPSHEPGIFSFYVLCDGVMCSNIKQFEFRESVDVRREFENPEKPSISARILDANKHNEDLTLLHQVRLAKFLLPKDNETSGQAISSDLASSQIGNGKLEFLMVDENRWNIMEASITNGHYTYEDVRSMLGEAFYKSALCQWLKRKAIGENVTSLDKHGLGVLHMVAALGYDWAIPPLLAAGFGVNFRDVNGWTALHWAAFCGREKVTALLLTAGAAPGAVTDPTPSNPSGRTASELAASSGHHGIAGYLGEALVTSHFSSLHLNEMSKLSAEFAKDQAIEAMSERNTAVDETLGVTDDDLSLRDSLAAVRNATKAEACITRVFRALSFQRKQEKEDSGLNEFGIRDEEARAFAAAFSVSRGYALEKSNLAATQIQCKFRGYRARNEFLSLKKHVVRIQAHVRGHQARKKYKKILWTVGVVEKAILRWRRKGSGLRGYKAEGIEDEDSDDDSFLKESRKQKEIAFSEAVGRVKKMIQNPEARNQYRRMLDINQKEKGAQMDDDLVIFDDELMSLLL
ncbi:hypothetical protein KP509_12G055700 [Ceratopteris richardii]|uniref:CG-1 domain-containing protein n=2 Tax=Ceratopteris richardii TaxID=49495 RepID=A0A8T2TLT9_CERRI|nr:hypothetical protein KP509_12G055700 [Ceratopteris richardii]